MELEQTNINSYISYINHNIDLTLSFDNLNNTLSHSHDSYITNNALVLNIEDIKELYNIYYNDPDKYSYQLNNILFINNERDIHVLNNNLYTLNNFYINENNEIIFRLDESNNSSIFSYNGIGFSYIYSNESNLHKANSYQTGIYKIDEDDIILNNDNQISINSIKYDFNENNINRLVDNYSYVLNQYNDNIYKFSKTKKYKNINHTQNNEIINVDNYQSIIENNDINNLDISNYYRDTNYNKLIEENISIVKDTNYFIIDIPIIYKYESSNTIYYQVNEDLCPIDIHKFGYEIQSLNQLESDTNLSDEKIKMNEAINRFYVSNINLDIEKSYVHDSKNIYIKASEDDMFYYNVYVLSRVSLYFNINSEIYNNIGINIGIKNINIISGFDNVLNLKITYDNQEESLKLLNTFLLIDNSFHHLKKLYHNYNYGFNFDKHGECIGMLLFPINSEIDNIGNISNYKYLNKSTNEINNLYSFNEKYYKDIYVNFSESSLNDIFVNCNINFNQDDINNVSFNEYSYYDGENDIICESYDNDLNNYIGEEKITIQTNDQINIPKLYCNDINYLQLLLGLNDINLKNDKLNKYYNNFTKYNNQNVKNISFYGDERTRILNYIGLNNNNFKLFYTGNKENENHNILNNPYIINQEIHNKIFKDIYLYRKSGLRYGDFFTPSYQNYMMIKYFNILEYLNNNLYDEYNKEEYNILFGTSQFITKDSYCFEHGLSKTLDDLILISNNLNDQIKIWPMFILPDFSIINSNNYIIQFNKENNFENINYYIDKNTKSIYINFRVYNTELVRFEFFTNNQNINIGKYEIIDKKNNIYQLNIYSNKNLNSQSFDIFYKDSVDYLNINNIENKNYRILCKVYLKKYNN